MAGVDDLIRNTTGLVGLTPENTSIYLCGHSDDDRNGKGILAPRGWQKDQMKEEVYFIPRKDTPSPRADSGVTERETDFVVARGIAAVPLSSSQCPSRPGIPSDGRWARLTDAQTYCTVCTDRNDR